MGIRDNQIHALEAATQQTLWGPNHKGSASLGLMFSPTIFRLPLVFAVTAAMVATLTPRPSSLSSNPGPDEGVEAFSW